MDNDKLLTPYARQRWELFRKQSDQEIGNKELSDTVGLIVRTVDDVTNQPVIAAGCATSGAAFKQVCQAGPFVTAGFYFVFGRMVELVILLYLVVGYMPKMVLELLQVREMEISL